MREPIRQIRMQLAIAVSSRGVTKSLLMCSSGCVARLTLLLRWKIEKIDPHNEESDIVR